VFAWLIGFSIENSSQALSPSPSIAKASTDHKRGVRVLTAILADTRRVSLDVAGVERACGRRAE